MTFFFLKSYIYLQSGGVIGEQAFFAYPSMDANIGTSSPYLGD
jgi:hypothetical protein